MGALDYKKRIAFTPFFLFEKKEYKKQNLIDHTIFDKKRNLFIHHGSFETKCQ